MPVRWYSSARMIVPRSVRHASLALRQAHRADRARRVLARRASTGSTDASADNIASGSTGSAAGRSIKIALASVGIIGAGGALYAWQNGLPILEFLNVKSLARQAIEPQLQATPLRVTPEAREPDPSEPKTTIEVELRRAPSAHNAEEHPLPTESTSKAETEAERTEPTSARSESDAVEPQLAATEDPMHAEIQSDATSQPQAVETTPTPLVDVVLLEAQQASKEAAAATLAKAESERLAGMEKRNAAMQELIAAVASRDLLRIQNAIQSATDANLGNCTELAVARCFLPSSLQSQTTLPVSGVVSMPSELHGLSPGQAFNLEYLSTEEMSEEQLRERVVELSRFLAAGRLYNQAALEETLAIPLHAVELQGVERLEEALARLKADSNAKLDASCSALDTLLQGQYADIVTAAKAEATSEAEHALLSADSEMKEAAEHSIAEVKSTNLPDVVSFSGGLREMEEALEKEAARVEGIYSHNFFSNAVVQLENAVSAGRACEEELNKLCSVAREVDSFAADILAALPTSCASLCREGQIPTEASLKNGLHFKVGELITAAFLPPGGGMAAELMAGLFRRLYILNANADLPSEYENVVGRDVRENLAALRDLSNASNSGELQMAFLNLEASLTGSCRDRAEEHLAKVRAALLLRQAISVIKARMMCLSAPCDA